MQIYPLEYIEELTIFDVDIPDEIKKNIDEICEIVTAPEYNKTPNFILDKNKKKRNYDLDINLLKKYEKTLIVKNNGVKMEVDIIRKYLNKLTEHNEESIGLKIIAHIENIKHDYNEDELNYIGEQLFNIVTSNELFSDIYAKIYLKIMDYSFIVTPINNNFNKIIDFYNNSSEININNYDSICDRNKMLDKNKALILFYINLMKIGLFSQEAIKNYIINLQNLLMQKMNINNNNIIVDELTEFIYLMITHCLIIFKDDENWEEINNNIQYVSNMNRNNRPSITNKTIFKHLDLLDFIKLNK